MTAANDVCNIVACVNAVTKTLRHRKISSICRKDKRLYKPFPPLIAEKKLDAVARNTGMYVAYLNANCPMAWSSRNDIAVSEDTCKGMSRKKTYTNFKYALQPGAANFVSKSLNIPNVVSLVLIVSLLSFTASSPKVIRTNSENWEPTYSSNASGPTSSASSTYIMPKESTNTSVTGFVINKPDTILLCINSKKRVIGPYP